VIASGQPVLEIGMMGNFSLYEILLVLLVPVAIPIALVVWAVRTLGGSRRREAALLRRIEALEADRDPPR
jgi:hypothetical protein